MLPKSIKNTFQYFLYSQNEKPHLMGRRKKKPSYWEDPEAYVSESLAEIGHGFLDGLEEGRRKAQRYEDLATRLKIRRLLKEKKERKQRSQRGKKLLGKNVSKKMKDLEEYLEEG